MFFTKKYWIEATKELKKPKILAFAGIMIALRVALKTLSIPIVPNQLSIGVAFLINALGASVFGPVVAIVAAAISDTLGCIIAPSGPYFFPFIFVEIVGSLIFALFLYKQKLTASRIMLSRFCVVAVCNLLLNPLIMKWYNMLFFGKEYQLLVELRIVKNLLLFVPETLLLCAFFKAIQPVLSAAKLADKGNLSLKLWQILLLVMLSLSAVLVFLVYRELTKPGSIVWMSFIHNLL